MEEREERERGEDLFGVHRENTVSPRSPMVAVGGGGGRGKGSLLTLSRCCWPGNLISQRHTKVHLESHFSPRFFFLLSFWISAHNFFPFLSFSPFLVLFSFQLFFVNFTFFSPPPCFTILFLTSDSYIDFYVFLFYCHCADYSLFFCLFVCLSL